MTAPLLFRKPLLLSLLACALLAPAVHALTGDTPARAEPAAATAPARTPPVPLMWKVSDADNAVYLLGSFHLLRTDDYPLSNDVEQVYVDADKVVFEVPPADLADPDTAVKMQAIAGFGDERKLSTVLPADVRDKLGRMLGGERVAQLDAYEPWFISLSLLIGVSQQIGLDSTQGLDQHLMKRAAAEAKPTAGLETIDQQLKALDSTPIDEQIAGLRDFLDNPTEVPQMLRDMHEAWRTADIDRLTALAVDEMRRKTPETYRLINLDRNDAWVPQLRQMLDGASEGDTLVVVGAMHLLGDDGVVEKLRAQGYTVERVCSACKATGSSAAKR